MSIWDNPDLRAKIVAGAKIVALGKTYTVSELVYWTEADWAVYVEEPLWEGSLGYIWLEDVDPDNIVAPTI